jgi:hypothetical protein
MASRPLTHHELERVSRALAAEGLVEMRATRIVLSPDDTEAVARGKQRAVNVGILSQQPFRIDP